LNYTRLIHQNFFRTMTPYIGMIHYSFAPQQLELQFGAFIWRTKILTVFSLEPSGCRMSMSVSSRCWPLTEPSQIYSLPSLTA